MDYDRDDIFTADLYEEGLQEYLEELEEYRRAKRALAEIAASFTWSEGQCRKR